MHPDDTALHARYSTTGWIVRVTAAVVLVFVVLIVIMGLMFADHHGEDDELDGEGGAAVALDLDMSTFDPGFPAPPSQLAS